MDPLDYINVASMLAESGKLDITYLQGLQATHLYEPKWDGVRCLMMYDNGAVSLRSRSGRDMTARYPDLVEAAKQLLGPNRLVLDGEVLAFGPNGEMGFKWAHLRDAQSNPKKIAVLSKQHPAVFVAFDILHDNGVDLRGEPLRVRREHLVATAGLLFSGTKSIFMSPATDDPGLIMDIVHQFKLEGAMAKHKESLYRGGRARSWLKVKATKMLSAVVTGMEAGNGARSSTFGALNIAVVDGAGELISIGRVGSGFTQDDLEMLLPIIQNPDPNDPLIIEVEYLEETENGQLRFPVYRGRRLDVLLSECNVQQLAINAEHISA